MGATPFARLSAELVESPHVHRQNAVVSHWHFPVVSPHRAGTVTPFVWHVIQCPLVVFDAADAVFRDVDEPRLVPINQLDVLGVG